MNNKNNLPPPRASDAPSVNEYLLTVSVRFRAAKFAAVALLVIFLLGMLAVNRDELTVENFRYLARFLDADSTVYSYGSGSRKFAFTADSDIDFAVYRGDLAVAGSSSLNIYAYSGSNVLNQNYSLLNPIIKSSARNLLVYDLGGSSFSVFNTFSKLYGETLQYKIAGGANSDSGLFAIITRTAEYRGAVFVYDKDFNLVSRILKDKLVMAVAVREDGGELVTVSAYADNGDFKAEIMTSDPYSDTADKISNFDSLLPLKADYNGGGFTVVCDAKALFFDSNGLYAAEYDYAGGVPDYSVISGGFTILGFPINVVGDAHRLVILDKNGEVAAEKRFNGQIIKILTIGNDVFVLTEEKILRFPVFSNAEASYAIEKNSIDLLTDGENILYLCFSGRAVTLEIDRSLGDLRLPDGLPNG